MPKQAAGAWIEIPFTVTKKEPLRLLLNATKSYDFGKYRISLNGVKLAGEVDFYSPQYHQRRSSPARLLAGSRQLFTAPGVRRQERAFGRLLPRLGVAPAPPTAAARGGNGAREGSRLADQTSALPMTFRLTGQRKRLPWRVADRLPALVAGNLNRWNTFQAGYVSLKRS